ncbi:MAG: TRAP transporter small permease [Pseudomonadota bacterium]
MKQVLATAVGWIAKSTEAAVRLLTVVMLAVLAFQVFMRSALNLPPSWTEEVALLAFSWTVLLGIAYGVREGIHVRMDMLLDVFPPIVRGLFERAVLALVTCVGLFLAWSGWNYVESSAGTRSAAIAYPMPLLYSSVVVCGVLIALFGLERMVLYGRESPDDRDGLSPEGV